MTVIFLSLVYKYDNLDTFALNSAPLKLESYLRDKIKNIKILFLPLVVLDNDYIKNYKQLKILKTGDLICISNIFTGNSVTTSEIYSMIKKYSKNKIIIGGGPFLNYNYLSLLKDNYIDAYCHGAGELTLLELLNFMKEHKQKIKIINFLDNHKNWSTRESLKNNKNIETSMFCNSEEKFYNYSIVLPVPFKFSPIVSAITGCLYKKCVFCTLNSIGPYYKKPIKFFCDELDSYAKQCNTNNFVLSDDNALNDWPYYKQIFDYAISKNYKFNIVTLDWSHLNEEKIQYLSKILDKEKIARVYLDAGCERIFKLAKKNGDFNKIHEILKLLRKYGLIIYLYIIIGYPGETKKEIESYSSFIQTLEFDTLWMARVLPLKGSELYEKYKQFVYQDPDIKSNCGFITDEFDIDYLEYMRLKILKETRKNVRPREL